MAHDPSAWAQPDFRLRLVEPANVNAAYDGSDPAESANATLPIGVVNYIRLKVDETATGSDTTGFKFQAQINTDGYVDMISDAATTGAAPPVSTVLTTQFSDEDAITTERLTSAGSWVNGEGDAQSGVTTSYTLSNQATEFEIAFRINSWYDDAGTMTQILPTDTINIRAVEADGTVFTGTYVIPTISLSETDYYIGACQPETPTNALVIASNGDIYIFVEAYDMGGVLLCLKSTDGGKTWREGAGPSDRPTTSDIEGIDCMVNPADPDMICVVVDHSAGQVYYEYLMSTDGTSPDSYAVKDEVITSANSFTTNCISMYVRDEGSGNYTVVCAYTDDNGGGLPFCNYNIRSTGGTWGGSVNLDTTASTAFMSPVMVADSTDKLYIFYKDGQDQATPFNDGEIWYKTLSTSDVLSGRTSVVSGIIYDSNRSNMPHVAPVLYDDGGVEVIAHVYQKDSDTVIYSRHLRDGVLQGEATATDATVRSSVGASHQTIATLFVYNKTVHLFYCDNSTRDMFRDENDDEGGWGTSTEEIDAINLNWIWGRVITHSTANGGATVFAYVYDIQASADAGGYGHGWYGEYLLAEAPAATFPYPHRQNANTLLRM
jgi:hypothetical protein